jgi:two-component system response regulator HydG
MPTPVTILILAASPFAEACGESSAAAGLTVILARNRDEFARQLGQCEVDLVAIPAGEAGDGQLMAELARSLQPQARLLLLEEEGGDRSFPPWSPIAVLRPGNGWADELRRQVEILARGVDMDRFNHVADRPAATAGVAGEMIGNSPGMTRVNRMIEKVCQHSYPVLILGESGTGKELVARSIHRKGPRREQPFVPVDCSALTPSLIESELFGHVKGAFTGATSMKQGLMATANGGTLFLDEIGNLPVDLQAKLLRAIQEKEIKPVGSNDRIRTDARIIAATNRDLETATRDGSFRQDLYFRLNVVQIKLPRLCERNDDIQLLASAFLARFAAHRPQPLILGDDAMKRLQAYHWPGNVRELENAMERAVALASGPVLHAADLPTSLQYPAAIDKVTGEVISLAELERHAIFRAIREAGGDKLAAARLLGIGKTTLYRKLKQYEAADSKKSG